MKSTEDVKRFAADATDGISTTVRVAGYLTLLKLLYKQKIKPRTAILLIAAYHLNSERTNDKIYKTFKESCKRILEVTEEDKAKKCMGFDIN